jgi:hypothetical protein
VDGDDLQLQPRSRAPDADASKRRAAEALGLDL